MDWGIGRQIRGSVRMTVNTKYLCKSHMKIYHSRSFLKYTHTEKGFKWSYTLMGGMSMPSPNAIGYHTKIHC